MYIIVSSSFIASFPYLNKCRNCHFFVLSNLSRASPPPTTTTTRPAKQDDKIVWTCAVAAGPGQSVLTSGPWPELDSHPQQRLPHPVPALQVVHLHRMLSSAAAVPFQCLCRRTRPNSVYGKSCFHCPSQTNYSLLGR